MSSSTQQVPSSSFSVEPAAVVAKKKFGKNLNKLTKPPAPPIAAGAPTSSAGVGGGVSAGSLRSGSAPSTSSRSGLLLLSTKRSSNASASSSSGGLLGSKSSSAPRPLNTPSLRSESSAPKSAHDALLTAAAAAAGRVAPQPPAQQQPAWGLGEKQQQRTQPPTAAASSPAPAPAPTLAPKGGVSAGYHTGPSQPLQYDDSTERSQDITGTGGGTRPNSNSLGKRGQQGRLAPHRPTLGTDDFPDSGAEYERDGRINDVGVDISSSRSRSGGSMHSGGASRSSLSAPRAMSGGYSRSRSISSGGDSSEQQQYLQRQQSPLFDSKPSDVGSIEPDVGASKAESITENKAEQTDEQLKFMSRLAKERAEKRRAEEEARMNEQKERAARRLKELEKKMSSAPVSTKGPDRLSPRITVPKSTSTTAASAELSSISKTTYHHPVAPSTKANWRQQNQKSTTRGSSLSGSEIVLERLGRTTKNATNSSTSGSNAASLSSKHPSITNNNGRTLFDPNKISYSSLVGGSSAPRSISVDDDRLNKAENPAQYGGGHLNSSGAISQNRDPAQHFPGAQSSDNKETGDQPPVHMIQLSSYEDRDRGERGNAAGPRMLFDPKSGSMVAAPTRDESNSGGKGGRKERSKQKNRNIREQRDHKDHNDSVPVQAISISKRADSSGYNGSSSVSVVRRTNGAEVSGGAAGISDGKSLRRQRGRKEEPVMQRKDRKRTEKDVKNQWSDSPVSSRSDYNDSHGLHGSGHAVKSRQSGARNTNSRQSRQSSVSTEQIKIPRTCGVLYKMDEKGNYVCADGCEADQGYGAHSVPGGRVRNPTAHAIFVQQQKLQTEAISNPGGETDASSKLEEHGTKTYADVATSPDQHHKSGAGALSFDGNIGKYRWQQEHQPELFEKQQQKLLAEASSALLDNDHQKEDTYPSMESFDPAKTEESIDLLGGTRESSNAQTMDNPWAPTEAVLAAAAAAAAAAAQTTSHEVALEESSTAEIDDPATAADLELIINDDDDDVSDKEHGNLTYLGLGFDPTENMDSVIMSPSLRPNGASVDDEPLNLANLSLDATGVADSNSNSNPFGQLGAPSTFLGSSTWGAGGSSSVGISGLANWDFTTNSDAITAPDEASPEENRQQPTAATSFLSLNPLPPVSSEGTWGTGGLVGGLPGLGRTSFGSTQSNGKNAGHEND